MKIRSRSTESPEKLQMSAMIDIVFLLLVFFVMTFQIVAMEGDFSITPAAAAKENALELEIEVIPLHVKLTAAKDGSLASVLLGETKLMGLEDLHARIRTLYEANPKGLAETDLILTTDSSLKYQHVIDTITAVTGYMDQDGKIVKMIQMIKFATPQP